MACAASTKGWTVDPQGSTSQGELLPGYSSYLGTRAFARELADNLVCADQIEGGSA
jgi:hypothetical protein